MPKTLITGGYSGFQALAVTPVRYMSIRTHDRPGQVRLAFSQQHSSLTSIIAHHDVRLVETRLTSSSFPPSSLAQPDPRRGARDEDETRRASEDEVRDIHDDMNRKRRRHIRHLPESQPPASFYLDEMVEAGQYRARNQVRSTTASAKATTPDPEFCVSGEELGLRVQHHQYATNDKMQAPRKYRLNGVHFRKQLYLFQKNLNPPKERPTLAQARKVLRRSKSKVSNPRDRGTAHVHQRIIRRVSLAGRQAAKGQEED
ncbi:hypothetical protein ASPSYDRAFT_29684 [Aspergillus sydowii CBS 593.65]|uniref:Uncharacterized protein n=1 Tax=Aspergillus sydowii CBS 593.65 TaxID=1036612 RepID=A0A1L9TP30_9EURO|nr:uncharacterized protein ASPSYDRAFT_29684 [Aspergillus sydowii CBS 593.65]OJJ61186.1 hypothetical protein ASPSYDRAFT_29684 [Aspergillus sydowii CBS 593.65]